MDSDDIWVPESGCRTLLAAAEATAEMVGAHGLGEFIDENGGCFQTRGSLQPLEEKRIGLGEDGMLREWDLSKPSSFSILLYQNTIWPPGLVLTRRAYYDKVGPFDRAMVPLENWICSLDCADIGIAAFVNQVVIHYRRHQNSISLQSKEGNMGRIRELQHKAFCSAKRAEREPARKLWRAIQMLRMQGKVERFRKLAAASRYAEAAPSLRAFMRRYRLVRGYPTARGL